MAGELVRIVVKKEVLKYCDCLIQSFRPDLGVFGKNLCTVGDFFWYLPRNFPKLLVDIGKEKPTLLLLGARL